MSTNEHAQELPPLTNNLDFEGRARATELEEYGYRPSHATGLSKPLASSTGPSHLIPAVSE